MLNTAQLLSDVLNSFHWSLENASTIINSFVAMEHGTINYFFPLN